MIYVVPKMPRKGLFKGNPSVAGASLKGCLSYFEDKEYIQVDTEVINYNIKGLPNPYEHKVLCLQLGDRENQFVIDTSQITPHYFTELLEDPNKVKILCNAFFDLKFLFHYGIFPKNVYDIFLGESLLTLGIDTEKGYKGLESMSYRYLGVHLHDKGRKIKELDEPTIMYAAGDVRYMEDIMKHQLELLKTHDLEKAIEFENAFVTPLAYMSYKGVKIDKKEWEQHYYNNLEKLKEIDKKLAQWLLNNGYGEYTQNTLFFGITSSINWDSSKQVAPLFKKMGIPVEVKDSSTGKIKNTVDIKYLSKYIEDYPILPIYKEYKEVSKEINTYGLDFITEYINPITNRIHGDYYQLVNTGRISSSNPNLQNIPGEGKDGNAHPLRRAFKAEKGKKFIIADYKQQEPRILAEYCQDPYLMDFILNGDGDSHSLISSIISEYLIGKHITVSKKNNPYVPRFGKHLRSIGKMINLGLDYGKSAYSIKDDLKISQEEAQKIIDLIKEKTPEKQKFFRRQFNFVKKYGYTVIDSVTRRKRWFPYMERIRGSNPDSKALGELERFAQNSCIQGTGASMLKLAGIYFYLYTEREKIRGHTYMVLQVHDEIVVECPEDKAEEVKDVLVKCMVAAGEKFCKTIPIEVDAQIADEWLK